MKQLLGAIAFLLIAPGVGAGTEYFVSNDGNDASDGTSWRTAWKTIGRAVQDLKPGDILTVDSGTFAERVEIRAEGTPEQPIVIRARRSGFSTLSISRRVSGFASVPDTRFISAAKLTDQGVAVYEADTRVVLKRAPGLVDMDEFRASYFVDTKANMLYIHSSDGLPASAHVYKVTREAGFGLVMNKARHVRLEGLVFEGYYGEKGKGFAIGMQGTTSCEIRDCAFFVNSGGVTFNYGCTNDIVRDCLFVGNIDYYYAELSQIYCSAQTVGTRIENCRVLDAGCHGIRFYNSAKDCSAIGNLVKNCRIGLYYKASQGNRVAVRNVVVGCSYFNFGSGENQGPFECKENTFEEPNWIDRKVVAPDDSTLILRKDDKRPWEDVSPDLRAATWLQDPKFCDVDHDDYRLQADSPYRRTGPKGTDRGAFQFKGDVFFVASDGDDARDGLSLATAWRSVAKVNESAPAGATVYFRPGTYEGILKPAASGKADAPIVIRSHGKGRGAALQGADLSAVSFVSLEDVLLTGGVKIGGEGNTLSRVVVAAREGPAISLVAAKGARLSNILARSGAAAVEADAATQDLWLTSSVLQSEKTPFVAANAGSLYTEYNNYVPGKGAPPALIGGKPVATVEQMRAATGGDRSSISADPQFAPDGMHLLTDSPMIGAGQYGRHIGPGEVAAAVAEPKITEIAVRDVTPTSASLTWWTPNTSSALWRSTAGGWVTPPVISKIYYGTTPACDQEAVSYGDLYHRVSLFDLRPDTIYYYRVEIPHPFVQSPTQRFRTPPVYWRPARRSLWVATDGNDANDGASPEKAFRTIRKAAEEARAGDTVTVRDGVYEEVIFPAATGTPTAPIVFKSESLNGAELSGSNHVRPSAVILHSRRSIAIDGFRMRAFAHKDLGRRAGGDHAQIVIWGCKDILVQNCYQTAAGGYHLAFMARWTRNLTLRNNFFMRFEHTGAFMEVGGRINIVNNTFYGSLITDFEILKRTCFEELIGTPEYTNPEEYYETLVTIKDNLFWKGGKPQVRLIDLPLQRPDLCDMDYNAFVFQPGNRFQYIGGHGLIAGQAQAEGLAAWQKYSGYDKHSIMPTPGEAKLAGGTAEKLGDYDPLDGSPLKTAGEDGKPVGCSSNRAPVPVTLGL
jgi:hypothetical protein